MAADSAVVLKAEQGNVNVGFRKSVNAKQEVLDMYKEHVLRLQQHDDR